MADVVGPELAVFPFSDSALILVDGDPASAITLTDPDTRAVVPLSDTDPRGGSVRWRRISGGYVCASRPATDRSRYSPPSGPSLVPLRMQADAAALKRHEVDDRASRGHAGGDPECLR
jgi:hypothetical protein